VPVQVVVKTELIAREWSQRDEARVMMSLSEDCPHLMRLLGRIDLPGGRVALVFVFEEGGTLAHLVQSSMGRGYLRNPNTVRGIMVRVCDAVQSMHTAHTMHNDLNLANVLMAMDPVSRLPHVKGMRCQ
jgi:serine/threonine protein kinase